MYTHTATALNWNGSLVDAVFAGRQKTFDAVVAAAHKAFRRRGFTTIKLLEVDGRDVPLSAQYA